MTSTEVRARRSGCPVSAALEVLGDRWSLLIVRDLMVRGCSQFKDFHQAGEGIATNILASRLRRLIKAGVIEADEALRGKRRSAYRLTPKGIDLAPALLELLIWGATHENTAAPCGLVETMAANRGAVLEEVRRRWLERDLTPFPPRLLTVPRKKVGKTPA